MGLFEPKLLGALPVRLGLLRIASRMKSDSILKQSVRALFRRFGYSITRIGQASDGQEVRPIGPPYLENEEYGPGNLSIKKARVEQGGPFEWPDILALNRTVLQMVGDAKRIVELGGGTGFLAYEIASNPEVFVVSSEFDKAASDWASLHRSRPNIKYVSRPLEPEEGPFDLLISVEVIEHIRYYGSFLRDCSRLAPRAIFTTPNKYNSRWTPGRQTGPPAYECHVREFTAGEVYWVLRSFYEKVRLYGMPDPFMTGCVPVSVVSKMTPIIALCEGPLSWVTSCQGSSKHNGNDYRHST